MVKAIDQGSAWDAFGDDIGRAYYDDEDPFFFNITAIDDASSGWDWDGTPNFIWTWDEELYSEDGQFTFTIDQYAIYLSGQSCYIYIRDPDEAPAWHTLASDPYGSDPADASSTKYRIWLADQHAKALGNNWYQTEVKFVGHLYIAGIIDQTWTSQFYVNFYYES
jgi:hypothetical protein